MGLNGKNLTKVSLQICKLLMEIVEQKNPNISHSVLSSEFGDEVTNFLLREKYLTDGHNLETYWLGGEDKDVNVEWNEKLKSSVYLSGSGKYIPIKENELKTYEGIIQNITQAI